MSSKERIGIIFDVDAEVSKAKSNISSLSKIFDGVGGSKGNQLRDLLSDISAEYEKLANESGKTMSKIGDFTKAEKSSERLNQLLRRLDKEIGSISKSSKGDLSKFFPPEVADRIKKASDAVKTYNTILENSNKKKGAIGAVADEYEKQEKAARKAAEALKDLQDIQQGKSQKQAVTSDVKVKKQESLTAANAEVKQYSKELQQAQEAMDEFKIRKADLFERKTQNHSSEFRELRDNLATAETNFKGATDRAAELRRELKNMVVVGDLDAQIEAAEQSLKEAQTAAEQLKTKLDNVTASEFSRAFDEAKKKLEGMSGIDLSEITNIDDLTNLLDRFTNEGIEGLIRSLSEAGVEIRELGNANDQVGAKIRNTTNDVETQNRALEDVNGIKNRILQFFSLTNAMQLGRQAIRQTIETVKELDAAMTETAVVTDFSVGDMWDQLPEYTKTAKELGVSIQGVYEASTLYYQQGLNTKEVTDLTTETLKMARIAGLECADATDLMTAALRGFNMEINEANATRINDVYSKLAAITAADTEEIATAMTKTASIASSANMEFETTAALLSQIIETTREPAETAGTAMKTIIARFTEMKKATSEIINVDGEEINVNKVESALKSAGVALRDTNGEFRDLDDVFLELSSKWDDLDVMTQRYIATMAAGSRQQSRFIAMMQNYDRTMELVDAAYNSAGASSQQFGKTQESLESKLARLEASWQEFLMGISNSDAIKGVIDLLNGLLEVFNKGTTSASNFATFISRLFVVIGGLTLGKQIFNKMFASIGTSMGLGGQQAGQKFNAGISSTLGKGVSLRGLGQKLSNSNEIRKAGSKLRNQLKEIYGDMEKDSTISGQKLVKKLSDGMDNPQLFQANAGKIGSIMESAIGAQLDANNLTEEGQTWARGLIDAFVMEIQNGNDPVNAIKNMEAKIEAALEGPDAEKMFKNGQTGADSAKINFGMSTLENNGEVKSTGNGAAVVVTDKTVKNSSQLSANLTVAGMALNAAGMAGNMLASALEEAGVGSDELVDSLNSISSGLTTTGSLLMTVTALQKTFNKAAKANVWLAAAAILIGAVTTFASWIGKANERQKELNKSQVEGAQDKKEELDKNQELLNSYNDLLKQYEETGEGAEDLKKSKEELVKQFDLEKKGISALTHSYKEVAEAAKEAQLEMTKTAVKDYQLGLSGAMANAQSEGQKPTFGGAGWSGSNFEIDLGSGEYSALRTIIENIANEEGVTGLNFGEAGIGNMLVSGIGSSPEEQRIWLKIIGQALEEYGATFNDPSTSVAYSALAEFWANNSSYYQQASEMANNIDEAQYTLAQNAAETYHNEQDFNIKTMKDFSEAVKNITGQLTDYKIDDEEKTAIAIDILGKDNKQLELYGQAYTKILTMANAYAEDDFLEFVEDLDDLDIKIIADIEYNIDTSKSLKQIELELDQTQIYDALFGQTSRMKNFQTYGDKLLSGEEITDEEKQQMSQYIGQDFGMIEYRQWQRVQNQDTASQLAYFRKLAGQKEEEINTAIEKYMTSYVDAITNNETYLYGTATNAKGESYSSDKNALKNKDELKEWINTETAEGNEIDTNNTNYLKYAASGKDPNQAYDSGWSLRKHIDSYNEGYDLVNDPLYSETKINTRRTNDSSVTAYRNARNAVMQYYSYNDVTGLTMNSNGVKHFITATESLNQYTQAVHDLWSKGLITEDEYDSRFSREFDTEMFMNADLTNQWTTPSGLLTSAEMEKINENRVTRGTNLMEGQSEAMKLEIDYAYRDEEGRVAAYEKSLESIFINAGLTPEEMRGDFNNDGSVDYYDTKKLKNSVDTAVDLAQAVTTLSENGMLNEYYDSKTENFSFNDKLSNKTSSPIVGGMLEKAENFSAIARIEAAEKAGYKIKVETDDNGVQKTVIAIDDIKDDSETPIEFTFDMDMTALNALESRIEEIDGTQLKLEAEIDTAKIEAAETAFQTSLNEAENLNNVLGLMNENYQVSPENVGQLIELFPELIQGADVLDDGTVQLKKDLVDTFTGDYASGLEESATGYLGVIEEQNAALAESAKLFLDFSANGQEALGDNQETAEENIKAYINQALEKERTAQIEATTTEKSTNLSIDSAKASSLAQTTSLDEINKAIQIVAANYRSLWLISKGDMSIDPSTMSSVLVSNGTAEGYKAFVDTTNWITSDMIYDYLENPEGYTAKDQNGDENTDEETAQVIAMAEILKGAAQEDLNEQLKNDTERIKALSAYKHQLTELQNGPKTLEKDSKGTGSDNSGNKSETEKESGKLKSKIDEIDSAIKELADNDIVDMRMVNQLINQKIALQKQYKKTLEDELTMLDQELPQLWSEVVKKGNDKYIEYDKDTKMYVYADAFYDDFFKNGIPLENEQMGEIQDQLNGLNKIGSDQLAKQIAIKELVDNLVQNQAENYNAERALKGRERRQTEADAEEDLIGMLPEEIQPFFQALNTAEDARLEMQEIQANKVLAENLQQQLDAAYAGVPDYIKENMTFDEYSGYGIDLTKINQIEDKEAREEMLTAVQENAKILNEQYFDPLYDVKEQLSGGKLQKGILTTAKALKDFAKEVSDNDFNDGLLKVETGFKALDEALNGLIERIEDSELVDEFLNKKAIGGLGLGDKERDALLSNEKLVEFLGKSGLGPIVSEIGWGEGATNGELLSLANGFMGGALEQIGGFLNFDMMKILGDSGGLIEQGKQMVEQIVGKVAEVTGALIDAWTNREDILYNFLNVLERYLHDYEVMQRYSTQLEKGRMASVDDIRQNWEQQWQSLQDQLEMQQERIETRQDQLDRSRWNPFQLISGWDPTSDSLYENRGVKMAFDLLISAIGMLPMGLGAFGSQLNQLYEDYDKRVQEAYEDRLAAEMAILDIEDERLELVKIGAEEATEFEQKVLDALVQKEQEQIEELSRLNDAITDANSKLISTLQKNLDQIRQDRENEKKEEELGEKERRLAYLRQDTSGANMMEIKKLEEELEEGHEDYTDTLIDQKISELEKQNEAAAEQRQQQIDLLQAQLDWSQKYGLYWDAIYGMLYTIDENGNAVLNPENFDLDGNIRENSQLAQMLGTFSDRLGMSVWSSVLDNEEAKRLGRYYGAFIGNNGVSGEWADYWALLNPGADDPDYATPMPEIPDGIWGVLYRIETSIGKYFGSSNMGLWNAGERLEVGLKNILGDVFNIEEWANATAKGFHREDVIGKNTLTLMNGWNKLSEGLLGIADFGNKTSQSLTNRAGYNRHQNNGDNNISNYFNIGTVGENISLDDMVDKVSSALREVFSAGTNIVHHGR